MSVFNIFSLQVFATQSYKDKYWEISASHLRSCHLIKQQEVASKIPTDLGEQTSNFDMNVLFTILREAFIKKK